MAVQVTVAAPARAPRVGGIRPVANWVENARIGLSEEVVYISDGCTFPKDAPGLCYSQEAPLDKEGVGIDTFTGIAPFALYAGVECFLGPDNDFRERARRLLLEGEDRPIEERLAVYAAGGVDVGGGGNPVDWLGDVEGAADEGYLGRPIILVNRSTLVFLASQSVVQYGLDGMPYTPNGSPIVAGANVPTGVFGLGAVTIYRTPTIEFDTVDVRTNKDWAIAEAVYAITVDCDFRVYARPAA